MPLQFATINSTCGYESDVPGLVTFTYYSQPEGKVIKNGAYGTHM